ncbi:MAG: SUMF1/EgtB/PvdO family nonheme iron enzyme [Azospirillaceae bacterium]|nr:SUMF1/EgtB/PvdO family nonheme iron enzyme [Azospirillaceae bacterium]
MSQNHGRLVLLRLRLLLCLVAAALGPIPATVSAQQTPAPWDSKWYDPHPADGDLTLPLPCGGHIVFRPVDVLTGGDALSDRPITLGEPQTNFGYVDYIRNVYLAAPFVGPDGAQRFWIGKYDVTRDQYDAITKTTCAEPTPGGRVPQTNISWLDATTAAARLTEWLFSNARDKLPVRGKVPGFVRLPTETEWEYAARGGAKLNQEAFLARTWPMPEGIEAYVNAGTQGSNRLAQIGQKRPNPLGLYDMLGNADQMTIEPFRLNHTGRDYGMAGGVVARGGNYATPLDSLYTAKRTEILPYNPTTGAPNRLATMGFRLVISASSAGIDPTETSKIGDAFAKGLRDRSSLEQTDDPQTLIKQIRELANDETVQRGLDRIAAKLASDTSARTDQAFWALGAQVEAAAVMARFVWSLDRVAKTQEDLANSILFAGKPQQQEILQKAAARRNEEAAALDGYFRLVRQMSQSPVAGQIDRQIAVVRGEMLARGQCELPGFLPAVQAHSKLIVSGQAPSPDKARTDILAVPERTRAGCAN